MDRIIYPQPGGPIAVVMPVRLDLGAAETRRDALLRHARAVVPAGTPFRLVPEDSIPADRTWRDAWTADFSTPDGMGERA